jgi:hypothetical protein
VVPEYIVILGLAICALTWLVSYWTLYITARRLNKEVAELRRQLAERSSR